MSFARNDVLNGWREIAQYVGRDVRTVERWEKQRGLPVRRIPGAGRSTVYARVADLEQWLASSSEAPDFIADASVEIEPSGSAASIEPAKAIPAKEHLEFEPPVVSPRSQAQETVVAARRRFLIPALALTAGCAFALLVALPLARHARAHSQPTQPPRAVDGSGLASSTRHSPVAGVDELYLRGMFFLEQRTPDTLRRALEHFDAAIKSDPNYAPAYVGQANAYALLREYSVVPDEVAFPKAKAADEHALALDAKLPQAHASLGFIDYFWALDAPAAEREFQAALAIDPGSAVAHHWYGSVLTHEGRYAEAVRELDIAQRLQPSSSAIFISRAFAWGLNGHRNEARAMLEEHLAQDHNGDDHSSSTAYTVLGVLDMMEPRDVPAYLRAWRRATELRQDKRALRTVGLAEKAYLEGGEAGMWQSILVNEEKQPSDAVHSSMRTVDAEVRLRHPDKALADLDDLARRHDRSIISAFVDPVLFPLHTDPRYARLRDALKLPAPQ